MPRIFCAAALVIAVIVQAHPAQAREAPWCAVLGMGDDAIYWDCQYQSFEQCYPNILAGNRGFCNPNPAYQGGEPRTTSKPARRRRVRD
ncbi:MAG TPA: DUF3551 domain-containing protein [Pseudolabrys sp.]|nr:DUF3551 domain-containing protein [Pseudolabrys sp.]HZT26542.1 DUF3551 domain-containing protein [Pseudolabrys sp.]